MTLNVAEAERPRDEVAEYRATLATTDTALAQKDETIVARAVALAEMAKRQRSTAEERDWLKRFTPPAPPPGSHRMCRLGRGGHYLGRVPPLALVMLALVASYLAGAIPFAFLITKAVRGVDVRTIGSGNVGATNASRVLGRKWFMVVFTLDFAKGAAAVLAFALWPGFDGDDLTRLRMACGFAAIAGHVFPVFLGFRGGKGVATGAGVLTALAPLPALCAFGVFGVTLLLSRWVSLSSIVACGVLAPIAWGFGVATEIVAFCGTVGALVILLHRKNLARIAAGTEPKVFQKKQGDGHG